MTEKMWERLAQNQACADERGYGEAWAKMCAERTQEAFYAVRRAQLRSCNLTPVMNWKPAEKRE